MLTVPGRAYRAALRRTLRLPRWILAVLCLAGLGTLAVLPGMHPGTPQFQDRNLVIHWTGALGMSLPELDRLAARTSRELAALPAVDDVAATVGRAVSSDQIVSTNSAEIWVTIKPGAAYDSAVSQVRAIADGMPGVAGTVRARPDARRLQPRPGPGLRSPPSSTAARAGVTVSATSIEAVTVNTNASTIGRRNAPVGPETKATGATATSIASVAAHSGPRSSPQAARASSAPDGRPPS